VEFDWIDLSVGQDTRFIIDRKTTHLNLEYNDTSFVINCELKSFLSSSFMSAIGLTTSV